MITTSHADSNQRRSPRARAPKSVERFVDGLLGEEKHAKRVLSVALAVTGVLPQRTWRSTPSGAGWPPPAGAIRSTGRSRSIGS